MLMFPVPVSSNFSSISGRISKVAEEEGARGAAPQPLLCGRDTQRSRASVDDCNDVDDYDDGDAQSVTCLSRKAVGNASALREHHFPLCSSVAAAVRFGSAGLDVMQQNKHAHALPKVI